MTHFSIGPARRFIRELFGHEKIRYNFGYVPDKPDPRDLLYKVTRSGPLPESTNRRNLMSFPYRYNQFNIGSCVGNGGVGAFRRVLQVNGQPDFDPSRLFAYWIAREIKDQDTGATIRDLFKAMNKYGLCSERMWPYITDRYAEKPCDAAFIEAEQHQVITYRRVPQTKEAIKEVLSQGYPIVYGMILYESFMSEKVARSGVVPMPRRRIETMIGGHCKVMFDYEPAGVWELNSWGPEWGNNGTCQVPWEYILNPELAQDLWTLSLTE